MTGKLDIGQIEENAMLNLNNIYEADISEKDFTNYSPLTFSNSECPYFDPSQFNNFSKNIHSSIACFHLNCRGLSSNWNNFRELIDELRNDTFSFDFIGISEIFKCDLDQRLNLQYYHPLISRHRTDDTRGGVGLFIKQQFNYHIRDDLSVFIPHVMESLFIECETPAKKKIIIGTIYRPNTAPRADLDVYSKTLIDILDIVNSEKRDCVILGDMNIDLLKYNDHMKTNSYIDDIFACGFITTITKPTRVTDHSATLIDHVYTNKVSSPYETGIIITDVADHFGTYYIATDNSKAQTNPTILQKRSYSSKNIDIFNQILMQTDFSSVIHEPSAQTAYNIFSEKIKVIHNQAFPLKVIRTKNRKRRDPWITEALIKASKTKAKLHKIKLKKPSENNCLKYKAYNAELNKLKRKSKIDYFAKQINDHKHDMKATWTTLKQAMGQSKQNLQYPTSIVVSGKNITNRKQIANEFNNYFANICDNIHNQIPDSNAQFTEYLSENNINSMFLEEIDEYYILNIAKKLKPKLSCGHDNISTKLLKESIHNFVEPLTHIFNRSLCTGIVPDQLKLAKVIPIFKASDRNKCENYRPISLLPSISKILEKIMYNKLYGFISANSLFYKHQYGFRKKHTTVHPVLHLLNTCGEAQMQKPSQYMLSIFCDLSKAFDVLNHDILFHKMYRLGVRGTVLDWFKNYLHNRTQFVDVGSIVSDNIPIKNGVPQGSILGPLLFLIYVNDIGKSCNEQVLSFADDTTLIVTSNEPHLLYEKANNAANKLHTWFCANKLYLNASKTKYIIIAPQYKNTVQNLELRINHKVITRVECPTEAMKFLGIYIDSSITWKPHILQMNTKISRALFAIKQVKSFLPTYSLKTLYYALIHPHITYGILAWGNARSSLKNKMFLLQKRALRYIHNATYNSHTDPLFKNSEILKLDDIYEQQTVLFMYDYINHRLPISFNHMFKLKSEMVTGYNTRTTEYFHIPLSKTQFLDAMPIIHFPKIGNKWYDLISKSPSRSLFKNLIKNRFLSLYCIDVLCTNPRCIDCRI